MTGVQVVHRQHLPIGIAVDVSLPVDAKIVRVGQQAHGPQLVQFWYLFATQGGFALYEETPRQFLVVGTGMPVSTNWEHVGTVLTADDLVWHVFERIHAVLTEPKVGAQ